MAFPFFALSKGKWTKPLAYRTDAVSIEIVATAIPKREYYVASPAGRRLFDMALGPVALAFAGASGRDHLKRITELKAAHGQGWPARWMEERGIGHAEALLIHDPA